MKKTTWEDVPGILAQILEELRAGRPSSCNCAKPKQLELVEREAPASEPEQPKTEAAPAQEAPASDVLDREAIRLKVLAHNRENPELRLQVREIVAALTPSGEGKFNDVPDAKLPELLAQIEELVNAAA